MSKCLCQLVFTWCKNKADLETGTLRNPDKRDTLEGFLDLTRTPTGSSGSILLVSTDTTGPVFISNNDVFCQVKVIKSNVYILLILRDGSS